MKIPTYIIKNTKASFCDNISLIMARSCRLKYLLSHQTIGAVRFFPVFLTLRMVVLTEFFINSIGKRTTVNVRSLPDYSPPENPKWRPKRFCCRFSCS